MKTKTGITAGIGAGDALANITDITGIDLLAEKYEQITGKPCGCDARREKLNTLIPEISLSTA
jgi:hypothetical protein